MIVTSLSQVKEQYRNYAVRRTGIPFPNCVTYATARISDFVGKDTPLDEPNRIYGAGQLLERHSSCFTVSNTPKVGALAIFTSPYFQNAGHVAFVEVVGKRMLLSESNYGDYGAGYFRNVEMDFAIGSRHPYDNNIRLIGFLIHNDLNPKKQGKIGIKAHFQDFGWSSEVWDECIESNNGKRVEAIQLFTSDGTIIESVDVHIQNKGWLPTYKYPSANTIMGTVGQSLRLEALKIKTSKPCKARVKFENGWSAYADCDGKSLIGTVGQSKKVVGVEILRK